MDNKRVSERKKTVIKTFIRKSFADGAYTIMEMVSKDLSLTGVFLCAETMGALDLGDVVEIMVCDKDTRIYEGTAKVVRSAKFFNKADEQVESGFGLVFLEKKEGLTQMINKMLA